MSYFIQSAEGFWNNGLGWTTYEEADVFTPTEKRELELPVDGTWVKDTIELALEYAEYQYVQVHQAGEHGALFRNGKGYSVLSRNVVHTNDGVIYGVAIKEYFTAQEVMQDWEINYRRFIRTGESY